MSEDFITQGLEEDRYLKANKLANEFQKQIKNEIEKVCNEILQEARASGVDLFEEDPELDYAEFGIDNSRTLTTIRIECDLNQTHEEYGQLKLNIGFEWVDSDAQDPDCISPEMEDQIRSSESSLCYVLYKIQRGSEEDFDDMKRMTRESSWNGEICFGDDQWPYQPKEAPGIVFIPVESGGGITKKYQQLKQHFFECYVPVLEK